MAIGMIGDNCFGEKKHGVFDGGSCDYHFDGANGDPAVLCEALRKAAEDES